MCHTIPAEHSRKGFTLVELLLVIAIVGLLASMLLLALSRAKQKAQGTYCMNNTKQIMSALHLYANDAREWLPPNPDYLAPDVWASGDMQNTLEATDMSLLRDPNVSKLATYTAKTAGIYKCPGDKSNHVRSYSMSQAAGSKPTSLGSVDGPWLDGTHNHKANQTWRTYGKMSDMSAPSPAMLWLIEWRLSGLGH